MSIRFSNEEFIELKKLLPIYEWGLKTLMTKLDIIHEDLNFQGNSAIGYIRSRIKTPESIAEKLQKLDAPITAEGAKKHIKDIAGIRIIVPFAKDIYFLADLICSIPDVKILIKKDFISDPKPSGYRSYHIITEVPIFFSGKTEDVTIEIQIRTEAMNFWATLEHKVRYKYKDDIPQHLSEELAVIADKISELDNRMFTIHEITTLINQDA